MAALPEDKVGYWKKELTLSGPFQAGLICNYTPDLLVICTVNESGHDIEELFEVFQADIHVSCLLLNGILRKEPMESCSTQSIILRQVIQS